MIYFLVALIVVTLPLTLWGLIDAYIAYRFVRKPEIDSTAGLKWWLELKWLLASQTKGLADIFPWLSQDLGERWGVREDDGRIT